MTENFDSQEEQQNLDHKKNEEEQERLKQEGGRFLDDIAELGKSESLKELLRSYDSELHNLEWENSSVTSAFFSPGEFIEYVRSSPLYSRIFVEEMIGRVEEKLSKVQENYNVAVEQRISYKKTGNSSTDYYIEKWLGGRINFIKTLQESGEESLKLLKTELLGMPLDEDIG